MNIEYPIRLQSFLAKSGFGSRRFCEQLITEGRVRINAKVVTQLGTRVDKDDVVMVDDYLAEIEERLHYYALNKPKGYVSSNYDPKERLFARNLIDIRERNLLFHVGRLDKDSTGLLLFTNDGESAHKITHPSFEIEKEYQVTTNETIEREDLEEALKGVYIDSQRPYTIKSFTFQSKKCVNVTLIEGRNREIRKIFTHFGYKIKKLNRIRIGPIKLDNLAVGEFRTVSKREIEDLLKGKNNG